MKPIRIIDMDFNILAEIDDYENLMWSRRFYSVSEFEFSINQNKNHTDKLQIENIVIFNAMYGVICYRELVLNEEGKKSEMILIKGVSLAGLFSRRITFPPVGKAYDTIKSSAETVMKALVVNNCINTAPERQLSLLSVAPDKNRGGNISWQSRYKQLDEEIQELSVVSNLGYVIYPDFNQNKLLFDVYESKDLSVSQTVNNPVIFSAAFDNILYQRSVESIIGFKNCAVVAGQGEGAEREIAVVNKTISGLERREVFIDARDLEDSLSLPSRGLQKLSDMRRVLSFESDISDSVFKYRRDWDLGDVVTVQNTSWGMTLDARITEVSEVYEQPGMKLSVVFGNTVPTFLNRIKKDFEQTSQEVRR